MVWQVTAILAVVTYSISVLLERTLMRGKESDPIGFAIFFQFILGVILLAIALALNKFSLPVFSPTLIPQYALSTVLWSCYTVFSLKSYQKLTVGEVVIIGSANTLLTIFLGLTLLNESLTIGKIFGILLVLSAVWLVYFENLSFSSKQGIAYALIAALCSGAAVVNDAVILKSYNAFSYPVIMSFLPGIVLLAIYPTKLLQAKKFLTTKIFALICFFSFFYALQAIFYYLSLEKGAPASQLAPITSSSNVLIVILAALFLNERERITKKVLGAIIVTAGILLIQMS